MIVTSVGYGAAFGLFPIGWVVFSAILLYRVTVESGKFDVLKDSIGHLTNDPRLQVLLIAFAFGAFIEGAAGFGTPVAVAAAMLAGLGFSPFYAAALCLLANTAPVAFGSIGIPITTLAVTTGLPIDRLSAAVGRICAPISLIIPAYIIVVMGGWKSLRAVFPAAAVCGITFAGMQFAISNYMGPATDGHSRVARGDSRAGDSVARVESEGRLHIRRAPRQDRSDDSCDWTHPFRVDAVRIARRADPVVGLQTAAGTSQRGDHHVSLARAA